MIELAKVLSRGLMPGDGSTQKVERRYGKRNAIVQTKDGRKWHIHDKSCSLPMWGWPDWIPHFSMHPMNLKRFPHIGDWVVIETDNAAPKHGRTPEVVAWFLKKDYMTALGQAISREQHLVPWQYQPEFRKFVLSLIDSDSRPHGPQEVVWFAERIIYFCEVRVNHRYLGGIIRHYVGGVPAEEINKEARSN